MTALFSLHLSRIDEAGRPCFTYPTQASTEHVAAMTRGGTSITAQRAKVDSTELVMAPSPAARAFVGRDCLVKCKLRHYTFVSKAEYNYGAKVTGTKLRIVDIQAKNVSTTQS